MKKRCISLFLVFLMCFMCISVSTPASAADVSAVRTKMDNYVQFLRDYKKENKSDAHWNADLNQATLTAALDSGDLEIGLTKGECTYTGKHVRDNDCNSNYFAGARQCHGFAKYFCYYLYGSYPIAAISKSINAGYKTDSNWTYYSKSTGTSSFPGLQAGDLIRYWERDGKSSLHTAIVHYIDNGKIYVIDCNHSGLDGGACVVSATEIDGKWLNLKLSSFEAAYNNGKAYICRYNGTITQGTGSVTTKPGSAISATVTTRSAKSITENSAVLYGSTKASGAKITECGIFLGTTKNNMTKLGSDKINTASTDMWYSTNKYGRTLEPGTTYYYQAYAKVDGSTYYGDIRSFTTAVSSAGSLMLSNSTLSMQDSVCVQLTATTKPSGQNVTWKSSNPAVATVDSNGWITGVKAGSATITASMSYGGKTYTANCDVTVTSTQNPTAPSVPSVSVSGNNVSVSWNAVKNAKYYNIYIVASPWTWEALKYNAATTDTFYTFTDVKNGDYAVFVISRPNEDTVQSPWTSFSVSVPSMPVQENTYTGYVVGTNGRLAINSQPSSGYQIGAIPEGDACTVYPDKASGNWLWVEYNGVSGYAYSGYISKTAPVVTSAPETTYTGYVTGTNGRLAINSRPSSGYQIGAIPEGAACTVYPDKTSGNWYWVEYSGVSGYAYSKYIKLQ